MVATSPSSTLPGALWVEVNGQPAITLSEGGTVTTALAITASAHGIDRLLWIMSPDKLHHVTAGE